MLLSSIFLFFFFNDTATTEIYTLSLHDALPILMQTVALLEIFPEVRDRYQTRFKYIHVDEYQDTNHAQYRLVNILAAGHRNLCVVGDDDQCLIEGTLEIGRASCRERV